MGDALQRWVLRWLRVPAEPDPPAGSPSSMRVFRASPRYFRYKLIGWAIAQAGAVIALLFGLVVGWSFFTRWWDWGPLGALATVFGALAWIGFLLQIPFSYAALCLDYELRWYMLSDRSLRIREGVVGVREKTMTFANVQQIAVKQGPLQRLLGIADVEVRTAGGGSSGEGGGDNLHRGYFRGVEDAEAVRDTIRSRVERYRAGEEPDLPTGSGTTAEGAGAGAPPQEGAPGAEASATEAAREVLAEVRALRSLLPPRA